MHKRDSEAVRLNCYYMSLKMEEFVLKSKLQRKVISDLWDRMHAAFIFYGIEYLLGSIITIYLASILGDMTNMIFDSSFHLDNGYLIKLAICIVVSVVGVPLIEMVAELLLFKKSLEYCKLVLSRYLDKSFLAAKKMGEGEVSVEIEDQTIEFYSAFVELFECLVTIPVISIILLYQAMKISLPYTALIIFMAVIRLLVPMSLKKKRTEYNLREKELKQFIRNKEFDMLTAPEQYVRYGFSSMWIKKMYEKVNSFYIDKQKKINSMNSISDNLLQGMDKLYVVITCLVGAVMVAKGQILPGDVAKMLILLSVFDTVNGYIERVIKGIPVFFNSEKQVEKLYADEEKNGNVKLKSFGDIVVKDLSFSYDNYLAIEGLNLTIKEGMKVGIKGKNGSGKTTLSLILNGLIDEYSGQIVTNGVNWHQIDKECIHQHIEYLPQHPVVFKTNVIENISFSTDTKDTEKVERILDELGIKYLMDRNENLHNLSGGEKQKISIARAMYNDKKIWIMDEPDNQLDRETKLWLGEYISLSHKTIIVISHDSLLLERMDYVKEM